MSESEDILLAKWLAGDISDEQRKMLEAKYDLDELSAILEKQNQYTPESLGTDEMWIAINKKKANSQKEAPSNQTKTGFNIRRFLILLLALVLAKFLYNFIFNKDSVKTINTMDVQRTELAFVDGSSAVIGPQSTLIYDESKWNESRIVKLYGQAFFDVNKGRSFVVQTSAGKVEVLGTQFDVWTINDAYMRVSCQEGRVRVSDEAGVSKEINPNEEIYISEGKLGNINKVAKANKEWQQNFRNYQTTPVQILLSDLERFYKVSFSIDKSIENDVFSGILPTNDLEKCIRFLETSLSYEAEQKEKNISFKKSK